MLDASYRMVVMSLASQNIAINFYWLPIFYYKN